MKIKFIPANKHPQEIGQYLWRSCYGKIELINVDQFMGQYLCGMYCPSYFFIKEFGQRNVKQFNADQFSEKIEFEL